MPIEVRSQLFAIAHNALTNAFLHANPSRVEVSLNVTDELISLSIADDGVGLPADYVDRGRGIRGMVEDAESVRGKLIVDGERPGGGTSITCIVPCEANSHGDPNVND